MAIRFKYGMGAGIIGAFAAGQGAGRRRRQKYMQDMLIQQQRHRQRMEELDFRGGGRLGAGRARAGGGGQLGGRWIDPLVDRDQFAPFGATEQGMREYRVEQRAQGRAAARKGQLGQGYQGDLLPQWQSQAEIERQQELEDVAAKREHERGMQDARFDQDEAKQQREFDQAEGVAAVGRARNVVKEDIAQVRTEIENKEYPDGIKDKVREVLDEMEAVVGRNIFTDVAKLEQSLQPLYDELQGYQDQRTKPPTAQDKIKEKTIRWNRETGEIVPWDQGPQPGLTLIPVDEEGTPDFKNAYDPQEKANEKAAEKRQTRIDSASELYNKALNPKEGDDSLSHIKTPLDAFKEIINQEAVKEELGKMDDQWQERSRHGVPPKADAAAGEPAAVRTDPVATAEEQRVAELPGGESNPIPLRGRDDYAKIKPGQYFVTPDGTIRRKAE